MFAAKFCKRLNSLPQFFNGVPTKAGKAGIDHKHDHSYHLLLVGSDSQVSLDTQVLKPPTHVQKTQLP